MFYVCLLSIFLNNNFFVLVDFCAGVVPVLVEEDEALVVDVEVLVVGEEVAVEVASDDNRIAIHTRAWASCYRNGAMAR